MESKSIEEGLNVILFSQMHFSDVYYMYKVKFNISFIFLLKLFLESRPVTNTNISCSSWFYVFICPIKITKIQLNLVI